MVAELITQRHLLLLAIFLFVFVAADRASKKAVDGAIVALGIVVLIWAYYEGLH